MLTVLVASLALAAQTPPPLDTGVLRLGNRSVFVFRAPLGASQPSERAAAAGRRLEAAVTAALTDSVTTQSVNEGTLILVGGRPVFTVTPGDADTALGATLAEVAAAAAAQLRTAIGEQRESRTVTALLRAAALALFATLLFSLTLRLLRRGRTAALARLDHHGLTTRELGVGGFTVVRAEQLERWLRLTVGGLAWGLGVAAAYLYATFVLTRFPWTRPWGEALGAYLATTVGELLLGVLHTIPDLFTIVLIFIGARLAARALVAVFAAAQAGTLVIPGLHPETAEPTRKIAGALLWAGALIVAYPYFPGSGTDAFKGISVFAGLLLTLGSSGVVGQAMSGLVLMYSRALRVGDFVQVGEVEGTVTDLGLLSTKIRTNKLAEITIPSAVVLGTNVKNYTRLKEGRGVILHTRVTIGYDAPWRQVEALLMEAARRTGGVRAAPEPFVRQIALSDFYPEYELNIFVDEPQQKPAILSALHANIQDLFNEYGVQIMSPNYEGDKAEPVIVPKERWYAPPAKPEAAPEP